MATPAAAANPPSTPIEVEVKLRLHSAADHDRVASLLADHHRATYAQENYFFDGANAEFSSRRTIVRVRLYNTDEKATLTVKGEAVLVDGISTVPEQEEPLDPPTARAIVQEPTQLLQLPSAMFSKLLQTYSVQGIRALGGFRNERKVFDWDGLELELDATQYDWGTLYELEVETDSPEQVRSKLEAFFTEHGIEHSYSKVSKFANFVNRSLL